MEISFELYQSLKPLALDLLYSFEPSKLPYYTETNKVAEIIQVLVKNNIKK